jgi:hypothetical protein
MRVLRTVVHVPVLAVFHTGQHLAKSRSIAAELVGHNHAGHVGQPLQQLPKARLRRPRVPPALDQDTQDMPVLIHRTPAVMACPVNRQVHFIQMPRVAGSGAPVPECIRIGLAGRAAPLPDRLIGHDDAASEEELFHIAVAEAEPTTEPDAMTNDLRRTSVMLVSGG